MLMLLNLNTHMHTSIVAENIIYQNYSTYQICMIMSAAISRVQNKCYENIMYRQYTQA